MRSWVRYSVAVYLGLMVAGALGMQKSQSSEASSVPVGIHSPFPHELYPHTWNRKPAGHRKPGVGDPRSDAGQGQDGPAEM